MNNISVKRKNKIRDSKLDGFLNISNIVLLVLFAIVVSFPLLNYFSLAFNDGNYNIDVVIFPVKPTIEAFKYVFTGENAGYFWRSFLNSVFITLFITVVSNLVEALAAYPLSKPDCPFRGTIMMYFIITMLFSAGIIPVYLLMYQLGLLNNVWSIILISISNVTNLLFFKTFFEGLPSDIEEAAQLDGASDLQLFFMVIVPMSLPVFGSCCFFSIVGSWNSYGAAMLFISTTAKDAHPLAYYIYLLLVDSGKNKNNPWLTMNTKNVQSAAMLASIIPILLVYPYVVQYIKGGLTLGSVKG